MSLWGCCEVTEFRSDIPPTNNNEEKYYGFGHCFSDRLQRRLPLAGNLRSQCLTAVDQQGSRTPCRVSNYESMYSMDRSERALLPAARRTEAGADDSMRISGPSHTPRATMSTTRRRP